VRIFLKCSKSKIILTHRNSSQNNSFTFKKGLGLSKFLTHVSSECQDLILKLLTYNPEERFSAKQALAHPYFKDLVEMELKQSKLSFHGMFFNPTNISFNNESQSFIRK
jgi:serine/threonine protein kinase